LVRGLHILVEFVTHSIYRKKNDPKSKVTVLRQYLKLNLQLSERIALRSSVLVTNTSMSITFLVCLCTFHDNMQYSLFRASHLVTISGGKSQFEGKSMFRILRQQWTLNLQITEGIALRSSVSVTYTPMGIAFLICLCTFNDNVQHSLFRASHLATVCGGKMT